MENEDLIDRSDTFALTIDETLNEDRAPLVTMAKQEEKTLPNNSALYDKTISTNIVSYMRKPLKFITFRNLEST